MLIRSESEMLEYGKNYAAKLEIPAVIELIGDVGAGKTTFVRGLAQGLGINEPLSSPSFTISRFYQGEKATLTHYDFYRLNDPGLMMSDLLDKLHDHHNIIVIEWGKSVANVLPKNHPKIAFQCLDDGTRLVEQRP